MDKLSAPQFQVLVSEEIQHVISRLSTKTASAEGALERLEAALAHDRERVEARIRKLEDRERAVGIGDKGASENGGEAA